MDELSATEAAAEISPTESAGANEKVFVAVGITGIAAYISYVMWQNYQPRAPQVLWGNDGRPPRIRCVNFKPAQFQLLCRALSVWFREGEVTYEACKVMFVEDDPPVSRANLEKVVTGSVLFAHKEGGAVKNEAVSGVVCTVVYRSLVLVDNEPIDVFQLDNFSFLSRLSGKEYEESHCVGYTVDGKAVETVVYTTKGIVGGAKGARKGPHGADILEPLKQLVGPAVDSFSLKSDHSSLLGTQGEMEVSKRQKTPMNTEGDTSKTEFWVSPGTLFLRLACVLRVSTEKAPYRSMLRRHRHSSPLSSKINGILSFLRLSTKESAPLPLKGHYYCLVPCRVDLHHRHVESLRKWLTDSCAYYFSSDIGDEVFHSMITLATVGGGTSILLDFGAVQELCSLLHAYWMATDFVNLLNVTGFLPRGAHFGFVASDDTVGVYEGLSMKKEPLKDFCGFSAETLTSENTFYDMCCVNFDENGQLV
ncbi:hypothetical protein ADEAN_000533600 [Angomonas deanei]|uniref:Uncharacterized protein n=1 Tax=Angomonas deanei TaxID=59799 RepID=A0A7G2CDD9_9TRYP|nr:hypothetical protein ADEAN_000533600 [Angomonas deanei]